MYTLKNSADFIAEIRAIDEKLKGIRLNSIEVNRKERSIAYNFISAETIDGNLKNAVLETAEKNTVRAFSAVVVNITKIVSNDELINVSIYNYLREKYPSVSILLKPTDVVCSVVGNTVKYILRLTQGSADYLNGNGALKKLNAFLEKNFCSDFAGVTEVKAAEETVSLADEEVFESELSKIEHRTIKVKDVVVIDDATMGDSALYIEDATEGEVTVCGKITEISERETKKGKPFFIVHLDDTTGRTGGVYFSKKTTYYRIKELSVGDSIIARGSIEEYNGRKSFVFDKINRCTFPDDFVKKEKFKKKAPKEYKLVFPKPSTTIKVKSVFDETVELPDELTSTTYVVVDLETTGVNVMGDGITEIGAVKIVDGKISEEFSSLIKPDYRITEEIVKITGITEELVKNSPKIGAVLPDFMKFIENTVLVAHNADFDVKFIKRFAGAEEFEVNNRVMDTMELAKNYLPGIKRLDLHTVADKFGIVFHHHRALSDAYATAEAFIELMILKAKAEAKGGSK